MFIIDVQVIDRLFYLSAVCVLCVLLHRLRDHVNDKNKLPILIFPEGKRINEWIMKYLHHICINPPPGHVCVPVVGC